MSTQKQKEIVVADEEIKKATLNHCMNTFRHEDPHEDVEDLLTMVNSVHEDRMQQTDDEEEPMDISKDDFDELVRKLEKEKKGVMTFLLKQVIVSSKWFLGYAKDCWR